jgi:hypothetical protein
LVVHHVEIAVLVEQHFEHCLVRVEACQVHWGHTRVGCLFGY